MFVCLNHLQLIQHLLHLLVDLIGRRAARLLVFTPSSLALRHAQFVSVPALRRLPAVLPGPAVQSGGGRGHLLGARGGAGSFKVKEDEIFEDNSSSHTYLEDVNHVLTVPLLGDVTEAGSDVDAAADIHVHLHGLFLDLSVQI